MKHVLLLVLLLTACRRDTVERASPPESPQPEVAKQAEPPQQQQPPEPQLPHIEGPKLAFVDEASNDPALVAYRDELLAAVRKRDADALIALADPKIRTSFGGGAGPDDLRRKLEQPGMWNDLEQVLTLGGTFIGGSEGKAFWAPYVYSAWPDRQDAFTAYAVIADHVPLVDAPDGKPIALLSRNIVERVSDPSGAWTQVKTHDGRSGFVETRHLRSPVGYRAGFNKEGDRWRLTALVAGD